MKLHEEAAHHPLGVLDDLEHLDLGLLLLAELHADLPVVLGRRRVVGAHDGRDGGHLADPVGRGVGHVGAEEHHGPLHEGGQAILRDDVIHPAQLRVELQADVVDRLVALARNVGGDVLLEHALRRNA